jgi:hypothetical protein
VVFPRCQSNEGLQLIERVCMDALGPEVLREGVVSNEDDLIGSLNAQHPSA